VVAAVSYLLIYFAECSVQPDVVWHLLQGNEKDAEAQNIAKEVSTWRYLLFSLVAATASFST
jgi:hypothetical protein